MRFTHVCLSLLSAVAFSVFVGGCAQVISKDALAQKVQKPECSHFFGDRAIYMGDKDGYRYVHVRDLFAPCTFLGEHTYMVRDGDWPMDHPFELTRNAAKWQDVEWLGNDGPPGVPQNAFLSITPSFPVGAPSTRPTTMPASDR